MKKRSLSIAVLLLLVLAAVMAWKFLAVKPPEAQELEPAPEKQAVAENSGATPPPLSPPPIPGSGAAASPVAVDPMHQDMADQMHGENTTPQRDLELVSEFITLYGKVFGGNPIGDNADITMALTGAGGHKGRIFPPGHRVIRDGQLVDRWGTPYWFHPNSGDQMEIRSAGPDKSMFTEDDVVLNPSPPGFGASPTGSVSSP